MLRSKHDRADLPRRLPAPAPAHPAWHTFCPIWANVFQVKNNKKRHHHLRACVHIAGHRHRHLTPRTRAIVLAQRNLLRQPPGVCPAGKKQAVRRRPMGVESLFPSDLGLQSPAVHRRFASSTPLWYYVPGPKSKGPRHRVLTVGKPVGARPPHCSPETVDLDCSRADPNQLPQRPIRDSRPVFPSATDWVPRADARTPKSRAIAPPREPISLYYAGVSSPASTR